MEIKSFKKTGSNLYEITLDTNEKIKLYDEIILKYELLIDKKLDKKKLDKILAENELLDGYYKALRYVSIKMRSKREISEYLKKCEFSSKSIEYALDRLSKEGYLNEDVYVDAYLNDALNLSLNGPKKIKAELKKLGIREETTDKYLFQVKDEIWIERIKKIIEKKFKTNKNSTSFFKNKIYSALIMYGYESEMIREVISTYTFDTSEAFIKEADKAWRLLERKFEDAELIMKFKNKMYSKGFGVDEINSYIEKKEQ